MIIKNTTQVGNPIIRSKSKKIADFKTKEVKTIIKNLTDSMRHHNLVGMAAPQIGKAVRIFVTEIRKTKLRKISETDILRVFINPRIISFSKKEVTDWEGCGSVANAGLFAMVKRPLSLTVETYTEEGEKILFEASGLLARIIQHEMDHLNGIIFTDKADTKTYMSRDEYIKMKEDKNKRKAR